MHLKIKMLEPYLNTGTLTLTLDLYLFKLEPA